MDKVTVALTVKLIYYFKQSPTVQITKIIRPHKNIGVNGCARTDTESTVYDTAQKRAALWSSYMLSFMQHAKEKKCTANSTV